MLPQGGGAGDDDGSSMRPVESCTQALQCDDFCWLPRAVHACACVCMSVHASCVHASCVHASCVHASCVHASCVHASCVHASRVHASCVHSSCVHASCVLTLLVCPITAGVVLCATRSLLRGLRRGM
jgi:hypothetical protein